MHHYLKVIRSNANASKIAQILKIVVGASLLAVAFYSLVLLSNDTHHQAFAESSRDSTFTTVATGQSTMMDVYGVSRAELVSWLESHEQDTYYLTTPYAAADSRSPNGDINDYGADSDGTKAGMNCTGFVWHALCAAHGWRDDIATKLPALSGWVNAMRTKNLETRDFKTKQEMLASGYLEKGDIIWAWDGDRNQLSDIHHVGIFWGSSPSDDKMWHSEGSLINGMWTGTNLTSGIRGKVSEPTYTVIKLGGSLYGSFQLTKESADPGLTADNACYSLEGAVYGLFADADQARTHDESNALSTYTTNAAGKIASDEPLKIGNYYLAECKAPEGYALSETIYPLHIEPNQTSMVGGSSEQGQSKVTDTPLYAPPTPFAFKHDAQTNVNQALGAATLEGACFEVSYYDGYYDITNLPASPQRIWNIRSSAEGALLPDPAYKISGNDFFRTTEGQICLPLGTYVIKEITPPLGYLKGTFSGDTPQALMRVEASGTTVTPAGQIPIIVDRIIRGDFSFTKIDGQTGERMGPVPFLITSCTTGEAHLAVTDKNGMLSTESSWNAHSSKTNTNDALIQEWKADNRIPSDSIDTQSGIWFDGSLDAKSSIDNNVGALPYDTYHVEELPCDANEGYSLASFDIYITRDNMTLNMGTVDDNPIAELQLDTYLAENDGAKLIEANESTLISDAISYMNLNPTDTYTIAGELHKIAETGDDEGIVAQNEIQFSPVLPWGKMHITFELDTHDLKGARLVAIERISDSTGALIAVHDDLAYEQQTVYIDKPQEEIPLIPSEPEPTPNPEPMPEPEPMPKSEEEQPQHVPVKELPPMGDQFLILPIALIVVTAVICLIAAYKMKSSRSSDEIIIVRGPAHSKFDEWYRSLQSSDDPRN